MGGTRVGIGVFVVLFLMLTTSVWAGVAVPYPPSEFFNADPVPLPVRPSGNPLDYAAARIGLDIRDVELPRAYEGGYRLACRFPIIDAVSNRPLYMKEWAEGTTSSIDKEHRERKLLAVRRALVLLRGLEGGAAPVSDAGDPRHSPPGDVTVALKAALVPSGLTPAYSAAVIDLYTSYLAAAALATSGVSALTEEDRTFFAANPGYFLAPDGERIPDMTGNVDTHFRFVEKARRVRFEDIFAAADMLAAAAQAYVDRTAGWKPSDFLTVPAKPFDGVRFGDLTIAGLGVDTHTDAELLSIDLGGDDLYPQGAGACPVEGGHVALCIDHGGNDRYDAGNGRYVQGFGFLGAGYLIDLAGNDVYHSGPFSQAAGILGVGAIWDAAGDDSYSGGAFVQGAGMFGLGILLDSAGEDRYECATIGQGGATTLGLGVLSDLEGDDRYELGLGRAGDSMGQGPGFGQGGALSFRHLPWTKKLTAYGGVGLLTDAKGNDRYRSGGWCDQGGSYIMSLGVLNDSEGNDHYTSLTGLGSGIHITNAILIDRKGNDIYEGAFRSGGSGGDRSPGFLIDYEGNDVYESKSSCFGTGCKPFCVSLFIDYGGNDTYVSPEPSGPILFNLWDSVGGVWPESEPYLWPYALCLDLGGKDDYQVRNRANDAERHSFGHGLQLDTEWTGGDVIGPIANPLAAYGPMPLPSDVETSSWATEIRALQSPDLFARFQAVGRIAAADASVVPPLIRTLTASDHRPYNRDLTECLHYFLTDGRIADVDAELMAALLKARDPEVRTVFAMDIGNWKLPNCEAALIEAAQTDPASAVRVAAVAALQELASANAIAAVRTLAAHDPSDEVRRVSARFLGRVDGPASFDLLQKTLRDDPGPPVRVAAAEALTRLRDPRALDALRAASRSKDVYLQRAAAKGMASLYDVDGIGVLIESLTFPSIDAFVNYGVNVPNAVSAFAGVDMPEDQRYDQQKWRDWFRANREKIDIHTNADAYVAYMDLLMATRFSEEPEKIERYEEFVARYPNYPVATKALAQTLNAAAWRMVTAPDGSADRDLSRGLQLAKRSVELIPDPDAVDTLAEAFLANDQPDKAADVCRAALVRSPQHAGLREKLERAESAAKER